MRCQATYIHWISFLVTIRSVFANPVTYCMALSGSCVLELCMQILVQLINCLVNTTINITGHFYYRSVSVVRCCMHIYYCKNVLYYCIHRNFDICILHCKLVDHENLILKRSSGIQLDDQQNETAKTLSNLPSVQSLLYCENPLYYSHTQAIQT